MKSDNTELIVKHKNNQADSATEPDEVDINIKALKQGSIEPDETELETDDAELKTTSEIENEPEAEKEAETETKPELDKDTDTESESESESGSESESESEPADALDEILSKINSYPLPTPDISGMAPPAPPVPSHDN